MTNEEILEKLKSASVYDIEELIAYFESRVKFKKELSEAYNDGWPDFVDGDII